MRKLLNLKIMLACQPKWVSRNPQNLDLGAMQISKKDESLHYFSGRYIIHVCYFHDPEYKRLVAIKSPNVFLYNILPIYEFPHVSFQ